MGKIIKINKVMYCFKCEEGDFYFKTNNQDILNKFYEMRFNIKELDTMKLDTSKINFNEKGVLKNV